MRRTLLGLGSLASAIGLLVYVAMLATAVVQGVRGKADPDRGPLGMPEALYFAILSGTLLLTLVVLAFFVHDCVRNPRIRDDHRWAWVTVLLCGNAIVMPVYWWLKVRPGAAQDTSRSLPVSTS